MVTWIHALYLISVELFASVLAVSCERDVPCEKVSYSRETALGKL